MTSAGELELAIHCLRPLIEGRVVRGTAVAAGTLDACLFFTEPPGDELRALRLATGGPERARIGLERVRLARDEHLEGECARELEEVLVGCRVAAVRRVTGERRIEVVFDGPRGAATLIGECFGPRGNWFLLDAEHNVLASARRPGGARGDVQPGRAYRPPTGATPDADEVPPPPGDPVAWLRGRAEHFATIDGRLRASAIGQDLERELAREHKGIAGRIGGLQERQRAEAGAGAARRDAELLLAQPDVQRRGLDEIEVCDWYADGAPRAIALDPKLTVRANAERLFDRARRLEAGAAKTAELIADARQKLEQIERLQRELAGAKAAADLQRLARLAEETGPLVRRRAEKTRRKAPDRKPYHEFVSGEGWPIWVGRTRKDNDTLTLRLARGNDVWLHAAGGLAGSHVIIRLDRGKTASLESLLDAGTLALHFSKARGRPAGDVLYTPRKHVRKPKGFPPGKVEVLRSKTLRIEVEPDRLRRLLDGSSAGA